MTPSVFDTCFIVINMFEFYNLSLEIKFIRIKNRMNTLNKYLKENNISIEQLSETTTINEAVLKRIIDNKINPSNNSPIIINAISKIKKISIERVNTELTNFKYNKRKIMNKKSIKKFQQHFSNTSSYISSICTFLTLIFSSIICNLDIPYSNGKTIKYISMTKSYPTISITIVVLIGIFYGASIGLKFYSNKSTKRIQTNIISISKKDTTKFSFFLYLVSPLIISIVIIYINLLLLKYAYSSESITYAINIIFLNFLSALIIGFIILIKLLNIFLTYHPQIIFYFHNVTSFVYGFLKKL